MESNHKKISETAINRSISSVILISKQKATTILKNKPLKLQKSNHHNWQILTKLIISNISIGKEKFLEKIKLKFL